MKLFQEIHYWERLMFEIPHYAAEVYTKREDLRSAREHVLLVVRDYNRYGENIQEQVQNSEDQAKHFAKWGLQILSWTEHQAIIHTGT